MPKSSSLSPFLYCFVSHGSLQPQQSRKRDDGIEIAVSLDDRSEMTFVDQRRPHGYSITVRNAPDLLRDLVNYLTPNLALSLDFNDADRSARLDEQVHLNAVACAVP